MVRDFIQRTVGSNRAQASSVKDNFKNTRSKQESSGSKICVNSVGCLFTHIVIFSHEESFQTAESISHWQSDFSFSRQHCCLVLGAPVASTTQRCYGKAFRYSDELYIVRHVDNRLVICGQHLADRWFTQDFLAGFFYRHPVELEDVSNGEFLGTILDANLRTLSFQQTTASFQFRPFKSAGTEAHKLSAAAARICLASRYSFPDQQARSDVQQLVKSYLEYDYPATKLQQLATKFLQGRS